LINRRSGLPGGLGFGVRFVIEGSEGQTEDTATNSLDRRWMRLTPDH
jgi:hypothetical protein